MASIILDGLAKVLEVQGFSTIMPSSRQLRDGKIYSQLTNSVSGVAVALRVSILSGIEDGELCGRRLGEMAKEMMEEGDVPYVRWH